MRAFLLILFTSVMNCSIAQFHNLPIPKVSPRTQTTQQIGAGNITIAFGSPSVKGRDVWNNPNIIPQNGETIAWRAGANENTVIQFDTDVSIEGKPLKAGSYGFHILPNGHSHTLLFTPKDNLWGSYYLDIENDIVLQVNVQDTLCPFSEYLDFEFINRTENSVTVALEWADRRIAFQVSVDLNKTVIEKFRYALNGENTYRWQAWNDAAAWCLDRNTNLEEALTWVNRSIKGGYGGFASNFNKTNLSTKIQLLYELDNKVEMHQTINEILQLPYSIDEAHMIGGMFIEINEVEKSIDFFKSALKEYKDEWGIHYMIAIAYYENGELKKAKSHLKKCKANAPDFFHQRVEITLKEMEMKTYTYPRRK